MPAKGHGRYTGRRFRGVRQTTLEWDALEQIALSGNVAAGTVAGAVLAFNTGTNPERKITVYRIVGTLMFRTNADVEAVFNYGIYRAIQGVTLNPSTQADQDNWMWWSARVSSTSVFQDNRIYNIPIDIKVKRIIEPGDELRVGIVGQAIYNWAISARVLRKITGT